jgi:hypothetical protein
MVIGLGDTNKDPCKALTLNRKEYGIVGVRRAASVTDMHRDIKTAWGAGFPGDSRSQTFEHHDFFNLNR